jgi:hypothetical protein
LGRLLEILTALVQVEFKDDLYNKARTSIVKKHFIQQHWPGRNIKFKYINLSVMRKDDPLPMHFDSKNDQQEKYDHCLMVYSSFVRIGAYINMVLLVFVVLGVL